MFSQQLILIRRTGFRMRKFFYSEPEVITEPNNSPLDSVSSHTPVVTGDVEHSLNLLPALSDSHSFSPPLSPPPVVTISDTVSDVRTSADSAIEMLQGDINLEILDPPSDSDLTVAIARLSDDHGVLNSPEEPLAAPVRAPENPTWKVSRAVISVRTSFLTVLFSHLA